MSKFCLNAKCTINVTFNIVKRVSQPVTLQYCSSLTNTMSSCQNIPLGKSLIFCNKILRSFLMKLKKKV